MTYRIARSGQIFGPYSLAEVQRHIATGHVVASDLAQGDAAQEWLPIAVLFPGSPVQDAPPHPAGLPLLYPDPPNLPWWAALLLEVVTLGVFFVVWDLVESGWMRRVERSSNAIILYSISAVLFVLAVPDSVHSVAHSLFNAPAVAAPWSMPLTVSGLLVRLAARFVLRRELCSHFNGPEPLGLRLSSVMTLFFGGLYFQFHFNRINQLKRTLRLSVPA